MRNAFYSLIGATLTVYATSVSAANMVCGTLERSTPTSGPQMEHDYINTSDNQRIVILYEWSEGQSVEVATLRGSIYLLMSPGQKYCITGDLHNQAMDIFRTPVRLNKVVTAEKHNSSI